METLFIEVMPYYTTKSNLDQSQINDLLGNYTAFRQEGIDVRNIDNALQQKLNNINDVKSFTDEIFDPVSRLDDSGKSKEDVIIGILSVFDSMESSKQRKFSINSRYAEKSLPLNNRSNRSPRWFQRDYKHRQ